MNRLTACRVRGIIVAVIMLDTIRRFLFEGARPIDRTMLFIELAVLLVIVYAEVKAFRYDKRIALREKLIADRRTALAEFAASGLELQGSVPTGLGWTPDERKKKLAWQQSVTAWVEETHSFLEKHSHRAVAAFMLVSGSGTDHLMVTTSVGQMAELHDQIKHFYQRLVSHLGNLRGIIEMADMYF